MDHFVQIDGRAGSKTAGNPNDAPGVRHGNLQEGKGINSCGSKNCGKPIPFEAEGSTEYLIAELATSFGLADPRSQRTR
jgi:hypothetical protein